MSPCANFFRPHTVGRVIASARRRDYWLALALWLVCLAVTVIGLVLWDDTYAYVWQPPASMPATAAGFSSGQWESRTFAEVWRDWHPHGWFGFAEIAFLLIVGFALFGITYLAWLNLPRIHVYGSIPASCGRAFRGTTAVLLPATILTAAFGALIVGADQQLLPRHWVEPFAVVAIPASIALLLVWLGRVMTGARPTFAESVLPPRCEGCGYDLTHQPADGRCPECAFNIALSLTPNLKRRAVLWEERPGRETWLGTMQALLLRPGDFYAHARLKTPDAPAVRFAVWNYVLIALGAAGALGLVFAYMTYGLYGGGPGASEALLIMTSFALALALGCWFGHRSIAAGVVTWWLVRGPLPDYRWAAKVVAYESAYLWTFCAYWGLLAASFVVGEDWISELLGVRILRPFMVPPEFVVVVGGTVALGVLWLYRYTIALRAIRWSNF